MKREIILIFGKTGSGKSTLNKRLLLPNLDRCIIIDALLEYENGIVFTKFTDLVDYVNDNELYFPEKKFNLIVRFDNDSDIEYLFKLIYEIGNLYLVLEEAEIYISPYAKQSNFLRLVRYGRHKAISIIGIARRTSELSLDFRSQVNTIYTLKQTEVKDLKTLNDLGISGAENLQEYKFPEEHKENIHYIKKDF